MQQHAAGPCRRRHRLHPEAEQKAGRHHQQHHNQDADIRVSAYCRSSSRSKAGRVPLVDVNRSRASRTRCEAARRLRGGTMTGGSAGSWTTSGFSAGLLIKQHKSCPRTARAFASSICAAKSLRAALKRQRIALTGVKLTSRRCPARQRSSRASRLDVSQRLPPIFSTSE